MGGMDLFRDRRFFSERLLSGAAVSGVLLFIFGITAGAIWTINRVESAVRDSARRTLTTALATVHEAAKHWATRQQGLGAAVAANPELGKVVSQAVTSWQLTGHSGPAGVRLDSMLAPAVRSNGLAGYWIVGDEERPVHRWPATLAEDLPASMQEAVAKALDGLPSLSPFPGDTIARAQLTAVAPIRDPKGNAVAVLVLIFPIEQELDQVAEQSHNRSLGQTYFFDRSGLILGSSAMSRVTQAEPVLREPGKHELTRMAREAVRGQPGIDLDGYRDNRGVQVVGAWEWDEQLGLGLAVETDVSEVYRVSNTARKAILIGLALAVLLFSMVMLSVVQARRSAEAMSAIQRRLAAVLETTTDPVCFADRAGHAIYLNDAGHALLGAGRERPGRGAPPPQWSQLLLRPETLAHAATNGSWAGESTILTADGREITLSQVILCHRQRDGEVDFYSTIVRDITDRKQLERRLRDEKERAEVTLGSIGDAVVRTDSTGSVEYLNPVAEQLLGAPTSELAGRHISDVLSLVHEQTRDPLENPVDTCLREGRIVGRSNLSLLVRPDGREFAIDDSAAPIRDAEGDIIGAVLVFHDVSRARTLARQLAHQATHDFLTGLVNRHEFERRVGRALQRAQQEAVTHALCFLDLDQFKVVNDTCGHGAGDELLRQLANALQKKVRRRDTLARLGGDEFGVLLEHCPPGQATRVAHELLEAVQEFRFVWEGKPFALGVSIGVVPITGESESLAVVLRDADAACYAAKERGRNRVHFYEPNDAAMALRQGEMQWVSRITSALEESRFRLYGQAIVPLVPRQGERARVEVLLRMVERNGDLIAPGAFIPAAERYNLMGAVDRWVVKEVVSLYAAHQASGWQPIASINLSGASLSDPSMLAYVRDQLARHDLSPESLCFEITETAAIANLGLAAHFIRELKGMGCWFALDDFGSGMSSFAYLQSLPVDSLKIAGAFLRHIETDPVEYAMVEAIHRVGHVMRLKTVAEGVESLNTLETLRRIGVDYAQGYAIAEPRPLEELVAIAINPSRAAERARIPAPPGHPANPRSRPASV
jgi:diguanylate cyclase (GGDEF)-like protein/PAS domain S-box-containing protein